jgi:nucleotide-binding universal stress UspA family protein
MKPVSTKESVPAFVDTDATRKDLCPWTSLLMLTDGEHHSRQAMSWAFATAKAARIPLTILHVIDPYLKQFYNEIYSQGRKEYLEHVETEIRKHADTLQQQITEDADRWEVRPEILTPYGDAFKEISRVIKNGRYGLVIAGGKKVVGISAFRSWNLPAKLAAKLPDQSIIIIRQTPEQEAWKIN